MKRIFRCLVCGPILLSLLAGTLVAKIPAKRTKKKAIETEQEETPTPAPKPSPKPSATPEADPESEPSPPPSKKQGHASREESASPNASIEPGSLLEFSDELPRVRKLIESALALTTQNLTYTYSSDDPANGGMDCSGFTAYVLRKNGCPDVPRDASSQYVWLRKAGTFRAVLSQSSDTFELDDLRPGDLLFWIGTAATDHNPPVSHTMIYLGREKDSKNRVMVGSSDGRTYRGKSRWGVSVFDFNLNGSAPDSEKKVSSSRFVGYAHIPGLRD